MPPHQLTQTEIDTILFDLDGTLVDTEPAAAHAILSCFQEWKIEIDPSDSAFITGRTWESAFNFLFAKYRIPVGADQASAQMMQAYRDSLDQHLGIVPGGADAVRSLATRYELALVSGSYRKEILWALDKLDIRSHFKVILGAEDYPNSKPAPDGYLKALHMMNRQAHRTLVFEDSHPGISSARAAGTWVVAITGTNHFQQDTSHAHHHIPDLTEVNANWVSSLAKTLNPAHR